MTLYMRSVVHVAICNVLAVAPSIHLPGPKYLSMCKHACYWIINIVVIYGNILHIAPIKDVVV